MGCTQRIGFFLHIPLPPPLILAAIPAHEWLMRALFAYDLVGVQSEADLTTCAATWPARRGAEPVGDGTLRRLSAAALRAGAFPIGIDVDEFRDLGREPRSAQETLRRCASSTPSRRLLVGVDRLDYSKGLPHRIRALRELLERYPENRHSATLIQVAAPSREEVEAYADIRRELEGLCGAINGDFGELDWMPVRYIHRTVARKRLPGLYRPAASRW